MPMCWSLLPQTQAAIHSGDKFERMHGKFNFPKHDIYPTVWQILYSIQYQPLKLVWVQLRKPQRLTFFPQESSSVHRFWVRFHRNQVQIKDFQFGRTDFQYVLWKRTENIWVELDFYGNKLKICVFELKIYKSNSIPVEKSEPPWQDWLMLL